MALSYTAGLPLELGPRGGERWAAGVSTPRQCPPVAVGMDAGTASSITASSGLPLSLKSSSSASQDTSHDSLAALNVRVQVGLHRAAGVTRDSASGFQPSLLTSRSGSSISSSAPPIELSKSSKDKCFGVLAPSDSSSSSCACMPPIARGVTAAGPKLNRAVNCLATELRRVQEAVQRHVSEGQRSENVVAARADAVLVAKERALAMEACVERRREDVTSLERQLVEDAQAFAAEGVRGRIEVAASEAQAEQQLAKAFSDFEQFQERQGRRRSRLEEEVVAAKRESATLRETLSFLPPDAARARLVADAIGDAVNSASGNGLGDLLDGAAVWPRLLSEAAHAVAEAFGLPNPVAQLPCVLKIPAVGGQSALDVAAVAMTERLLGLATTAQAGEASTARRADLEHTLFQERARADRLDEELKALQTEQHELLDDYAAARRRRRELEVEQAEFVPFAAGELEGAIERVASVRKAPVRIRKLAASAGHRFRERRRALRAQAAAARCLPERAIGANSSMSKHRSRAVCPGFCTCCGSP
mmetsp:Transcript_86914/g.243542  ORF Transcript_86914/g.243542 Transcript_86914/m.243542 type:complete len:534 (-) Transcript_86914:11-1612(-)